MKYFLGKLAGIVMLLAGGAWLQRLVTLDTPFLVLPSVLKYQGALLLIVIGFFTLLLTSRAASAHKRKTALQRQYPAQPWMWRGDWAHNTSQSSTRLQIWTTLFALIWTLLLVPIVIAAIPKYRHDLLFMVVFGYGFPLVGVGMLLWQGYKWLRYWLAGKVMLRFSQLPARLGKKFDCEVTVPLQARALRYETELVCFYEHVVTTRIQDEYRSEWVRDEKWRDVISPQSVVTAAGTHLMMRFQLPEEQSTTAYEQEQGTRWYVMVRAVNKAGRTRFEREFEVPVAAHPDHDRGIEQPAVAGRATFTLPDMEDGRVMHGAVAQQSMRDGLAEQDEGENTRPPVDAIRRLSEIGVRFSKEGIEYADAVWKNTGIHKVGIAMTLVPLVLTVAFAAIFYTKVIVQGDWFGLPLGLGVLIGLVMLAIVTFLRYHRFTIAFTSQGIVRQSRLFAWQWQQLFPWDNVRKVTTSASSSVTNGARRVHYDKVVIYGETYKQNLAMSPGFRDKDDVTLLRDLIRYHVEQNRA